ncbi:hypothetical protein TYRP_019325 [Tyrophagus putrescentiae]|nr:hypothetical protein TYRP_019325 [Tyrophagus putrescentiae]
MSFLAVPESSVAGYPGYVLPSRIPVADVESNDAQSEPTGFCNTCLYWMFSNQRFCLRSGRKCEPAVSLHSLRCQVTHHPSSRQDFSRHIGWSHSCSTPLPTQSNSTEEAPSVRSRFATEIRRAGRAAKKQ